jgi:diaminohydroxyphosphoribosylaminopyrimidine deaminase/5-amino-6-(5-phosphoribosylamino)uracil reductase
VLTGIGTVLADDPKLDVRLVETPRQPHLVVVDSRLETPLDAHLFIAGRALYIYAAVQNDEKKAALENRGATVVYMPGQEAGTENKVDLAAMLRDLAVREINELHVEAGHKLNGSLIREGLVDEFVVYLAPKLIGQGCDMASFGPLHELSQAIPLEFKRTEMLGPDLRILARIPGRDQF